jgi:hypothetical protein
LSESSLEDRGAGGLPWRRDVRFATVLPPEALSRATPEVEPMMRTLLDWLLYAHSGGQFLELAAITAHFAPDDPGRYRQYLPELLEMPDRPVVKLFLVDYLRCSPWPLTRYQEWSMLLRAAHDGVEGWFPVTMPVTTWVARQGGHHLGFPKYVAESITLVDDGTAVNGRANANGRLDVSMRYSDDAPPTLARWERDLRAHDAFIEGDLIVLKPTGVGPDVQRVRFDEVVPSRWTTRHGSVELHGDAGGLIPSGRTVPGSAHHFQGGMNLVRTTPAARVIPFSRASHRARTGEKTRAA